jgi:RsiW-degrading membrane proteinase PrsW (M82 family)
MNYLPLVLGLLPSFAWLIFYLKEDPHPEPKSLIVEIFIAGAASTSLTLGFQLLFHNLLLFNGIAPYSFLSLFGLATIEEVFKFLAAFTIVSHHKKDFDEPVDAMIYMIVAALGFATVENIAASFNTPDLSLETTSLRFIGATLLHTLSSGLIGYFWAKYLIFKKTELWIRGGLLAILLHVVFNYLIIRFEPVIVPTTFLIILALFILYDFEKLKHI